MSTEIRLVNQTFIDELHNQQELAKKKYVVLKKVDSDKQNQEKLQQKSDQNKSKDEFLVFNYLWRHLPEAMAFNAAFKNWLGPGCMRLVMDDSEFNRILRAAKRYYRVSLFVSNIPTLAFLSLAGWALALESGFGFLFIIGALFSGMLAIGNSLLICPNNHPITIKKRERMVALCKEKQQDE